jgi:hypothetical protein
MADGSCDVHQTELTKLATELSSSFGEKMKILGEQIQQEADDLKNDQPENPGDIGGVVGFTFKVDWADVSIKFDLPEFVMKTQEWSFDVPQVTMRDQTMIFHTPSVRMKTVKIGQKPEFGPWGVKFTDLLADVPEPFMQEHRIVMGVPEFKVDRTAMVLDIPEVTMKTQEIIIGLPQFTLVDVQGEIGEYQARAEQFKDASQAKFDLVKTAFTTDAREQIGVAANTFFSCLRTQIQNKRAEAAASLEPAIVMLRDSKSKFANINSDEARAKAIEIGQQLEIALSKKADMDERFAESIAILVEKEREVTSSIVNALAGLTNKAPASASAKSATVDA